MVVARGDRAADRRRATAVERAVAFLLLVVVGNGTASAQGWEDLSPEQRSRALQNFQQYQRMPERSRARIERRYESFRGMAPSEQDQVRRNFGIYRQMSPEQRQDFMDRYQRFRGTR